MNILEKRSENAIKEELFKFLPKSQREAISQSKSMMELARRTYVYGGSSSAALKVLSEVEAFCKWIRMEPDAMIQSKRIKWHSLLNDYTEELIMSGEFARSTVRSRIYAIRKWLALNGVQLKGWVVLPRVWRVESDRAPLKSEVRLILRNALLKDIVMTLLALSSGMRMGTIIHLQLKDIRLDERIPTIIIPPEYAKNRPYGYVTFITPETKHFILEHLRERKAQGEQITPETYLLSNLIAANYVERNVPMRTGNIGLRWNNLLRKAGKAMYGRSRHVLHFHTLRKYFATWTRLSGMDPFLSEALMGHESGLHQIYFTTGARSSENPAIIQLLKIEYSKAIPALTIFPRNRRASYNVYRDGRKFNFGSSSILSKSTSLKLDQPYLIDLFEIEEQLKSQRKEIREVKDTLNELIRSFDYKIRKRDFGRWKLRVIPVSLERISQSAADLTTIEQTLQNQSAVIERISRMLTYLARTSNDFPRNMITVSSGKPKEHGRAQALEVEQINGEENERVDWDPARLAREAIEGRKIRKNEIQAPWDWPLRSNRPWASVRYARWLRSQHERDASTLETPPKNYFMQIFNRE